MFMIRPKMRGAYKGFLSGGWGSVYKPVENHLHVVPDIGVPVFVDGKAGRGVEQLQAQQTNLTIRLL